MIKQCFLSIFLLFNCFCYSQDLSDTTFNKELKNSVFFELGGATGYLSLNYEREIRISKRLFIKPGIGYGVTVKTPITQGNVISYTIRTDFLYGNKRVNPVIGFAFSQNFDFEYVKNVYNIYSPNIGLNIRVFDSFILLPKYYFMIFDETEYYKNYFVHWAGLQIKINF
jgi:hypothetical protein